MAIFFLEILACDRESKSYCDMYRRVPSGIRTVFSAIFNNISVIFWKLVLLVEKTRISEENYIPFIKQVDLICHLLKVFQCLPIIIQCL
jgi:hypothetical protein